MQPLHRIMAPYESVSFVPRRPELFDWENDETFGSASPDATEPDIEQTNPVITDSVDDYTIAVIARTALQ